MPAYDVGLYHELRIEAPASVVFETIDRVSFDSAPVARALFRARAALLRARSDGDRASGGFIEQMTELGWKIVARDPGRELVFGAVTQPWRPNPEFRGLAPEEFAAFDEPGYAKLALTIRVDPFDENASVVCTETRVQSTDQTSYALFRRYWALFSPGIEVIRVALLHRLKNEAERLSSAT